MLNVAWQGRELFEAYSRIKGVPMDKVLRNAMRDVVGYLVKHMPVHQSREPIAWRAKRGGKTVILPLSILDDADRARVLGMSVATRGKRKGQLIRNKRMKSLGVQVHAGWQRASLLTASRQIGIHSFSVPKQARKATGLSSMTATGLGGKNPCFEMVDRIGFDAPSHASTAESLLAGGFDKANRTLVADFERELSNRWQ